MNDPAATASGPDDPPGSGEPARRWRWLIAPLLALVLVAAGASAVLGSRGGSEPDDAHALGTSAPLELASVSDDIAGHYRFAETHERELAAIACFCGCEEFLAHENLYDCFIRTDGAGYDSHAAGCGVCLGEAAVASRLLTAGTPAAEVANRIVEQFGITPITAPDQTIPRR